MLQGDFDGDRQKDVSLANFVDRVSARLGADCLQSFQLRESHVPERAVIAVPAIDTLSSPGRKTCRAVFLRPEASGPCGFSPAGAGGGLAAEVPDGPPAKFPLAPHAASCSPKRGAGDGLPWNGGSMARMPATRDYFRVEDDTGLSFLDLPRGSLRPDAAAALVHARSFRMMPPNSSRSAHERISRFWKGHRRPEEMVTQAAILKLSGLGIADRNSVAGVVRAHAQIRAIRARIQKTKEAGLLGGGRRRKRTFLNPFPFSRAPVWSFPMERRIFSPIRKTERAGRISAVC